VMLVGIAAAAGVIIAPLALGEEFSLAALLCAIALLAAGLLPAFQVLRGRAVAAVGVLVVTAAANWSLLCAGVLPGLEPLWLSQRVAGLVPEGAPVAAAGYHEPSLVFLLGSGTKLTDAPGAADFLMVTPQAVAVIAEADEEAFQRRLAAAGQAARGLGAVDGLNYSHGRPLRLSVWTLDAGGARP